MHEGTFFSLLNPNHLLLKDCCVIQHRPICSFFLGTKPFTDESKHFTIHLVAYNVINRTGMFFFSLSWAAVWDIAWNITIHLKRHVLKEEEAALILRLFPVNVCLMMRFFFFPKLLPHPYKEIAHRPLLLSCWILHSSSSGPGEEDEPWTHSSHPKFGL